MIVQVTWKVIYISQGQCLKSWSVCMIAWSFHHSFHALNILGAVKACLTSLGACLSASQLVVCMWHHAHTSSIQATTKSHTVAVWSCLHWANVVCNCCNHNFVAQQWWKLEADNQCRWSVGWIVIASELHAEDWAVDMPKLEFSANKIKAEMFYNNPSNDIQDHQFKVTFNSYS